MFPTDGSFDPDPVHRPRSPKRRWRPQLPGLPTRLGGLLVFAAMAALAIYAATHLPWALWDAWPLYLAASGPAVLHLAAVLLRRDERLAVPTRAETAAQWVRSRLDRLGLTAVQVIPSLGLRNFYAPLGDTIGLAENVHGERTMFAHAAAAHELGHAWIQRCSPHLAQLAGWCRRHCAHLWQLGFGLLFGVAMTGARPLLPLAFALLSAALLASTLVAIEELAATAVGLRELAASGVSPQELAFARRSLRAALSTYLGHALGHAVPLVAAPFLCTFFGEGLLPPGPGLAPGAQQLAELLAWGVLAGTVLLAMKSAAALAAGRTAPLTLLERLLCAVTGLVGFTLTLLCWRQPPASAAPLVTAVAALRIWGLAYLPTALALGLLGKLIARLEREPTALAPRPSTFAALAAMAKLARAHPEPAAASSFGLALWLSAPTIPLAILLLG